MRSAILVFALLALCCVLQSLPLAAASPHRHHKHRSSDHAQQADVAAAPADALLMTTECGPAQGAWLPVGDGPSASRVAVWRSIPYAAPPVGDLRWTAPRNPNCWQGTYDATNFRAICVQQSTDVAVGSEDCLYLHVYVPESLAKKNAERQQAGAAPTRGAPILFYIHGGSLTGGSGNFEPLAPFAAHARSAGGEEVIVVSINYRLTVFGFLALRELSEVAGDGNPAANFGILDQQAALRWVQRNAAAFGGDPTRVTLAGQSSGGTSIFALYSSLASRGLFSGAIALSGSINVSMTLEQGHAQNAGVVAAAGCAGKGDSAAVVACLRAAPALTLMRAVPESWSTPGLWGLEHLRPQGPPNYGGLPLVDGVTLQLSFGDALAAGLVDRPLILGNTGQEGDFAPDVDFTSWSADAFEDYVTKALESWNSPSLAKSVLRAYERMDNGSLADPEYVFASFNADYGLSCGTVQLALGAKLGAFRSPLYTFVSQWAPTTPQLIGLHLARYAYHTSDYSAAIENYSAAPSAQDRAQTVLLQRAWATFMADGSLDVLKDELGWEPFDAAPGFPAHWSTFVQRPGLNASHSEIDYKAGQCVLLAEYGFGPTFWWVD